MGHSATAGSIWVFAQPGLDCEGGSYLSNAITIVVSAILGWVASTAGGTGLFALRGGIGVLVCWSGLDGANRGSLDTHRCILGDDLVETAVHGEGCEWMWVRQERGGGKEEGAKVCEFVVRNQSQRTVEVRIGAEEMDP